MWWRLARSGGGATIPWVMGLHAATMTALVAALLAVQVGVGYRV